MLNQKNKQKKFDLRASEVVCIVVKNKHDDGLVFYSPFIII